MRLPPKTTSITPHLTVRDVREAVRFYEQGLGFSIRLMLPGGPSNTIRHAEVEHGGAVVMIGPESRERGLVAPITSGRPPPVSLYVYVNSVDDAHAQALGAGAVELIAPSDQFFGARTSVIADPDGHQWMLAEHQKVMTESEMKSALKDASQGEAQAHSVSVPSPKTSSPSAVRKPQLKKPIAPGRGSST